MNKGLRPRPIRLFERVFLAATALSVGSVFANYGMLREYTIARGGTPGGAAIVLVAAVIGLALSIILWFYIARRASNGAKWIVVAFTLLGIAFTIYDGATDGYEGLGTVYVVLEISATVLNGVAVWFLFRKDAAIWFAGKLIDPDVFS